MIAIFAGETGFGYRLLSVSGDTSDAHCFTACDCIAFGNCLGGQFQHWPQQIILRMADFKLCRVNAKRDTARACRMIIPGEGTLTALVEAPLRIERQRMCRNHYTPA